MTMFNHGRVRFDPLFEFIYYCVLYTKGKIGFPMARINQMRYSIIFKFDSRHLFARILIAKVFVRRSQTANLFRTLSRLLMKFFDALNSNTFPIRSDLNNKSEVISH